MSESKLDFILGAVTFGSAIVLLCIFAVDSKREENCAQKKCPVKMEKIRIQEKCLCVSTAQ